MGFTDTFNWVIYDNPVSQGVASATKQVLQLPVYLVKPIIQSVNGNSAPQVQIIHKTEPLYVLARQQGPFLKIAALSGAAATALAAYGAHKKYPKDRIVELKSIAENANKMHYFHTLALLGVPMTRHPAISGSFFLAGMVLFCGPCYYHAFTGENDYGKLAPVGGTMLILGWLAMMI